VSSGVPFRFLVNRLFCYSHFSEKSSGQWVDWLFELRVASFNKKVSTQYVLSNGVKVFGKNINAEPEKYFTKDILDQIDEACKKEFLYGQQDSIASIETEEMDSADAD
jgi:hypothetical protein